MDQEAFCSFPNSFVDNVVTATPMQNARHSPIVVLSAPTQILHNANAWPLSLASADLFSEKSRERRSREVALRGEPAFLTNQELGVTHDRSSPQELGPRTDPKEAT